MSNKTNILITGANAITGTTSPSTMECIAFTKPRITMPVGRSNTNTVQNNEVSNQGITQTTSVPTQLQPLTQLKMTIKWR